ncbi:SGNH/GDSL hydrolase family protein [Nitrosopumilus maritimus]|uniref:Lipolytic protein G-D-S-L family n=1 Tax=Nitrosopumilus maritimus (strain SCM1) TaxID=436308 RepID=A9A1Q5_NITMS|nr:SGNH/GDSL hydrolase family protein [Nitrosopumilus maritimus]ABX12026.1 lipolytic protein G-D-S-L family [Nitrosopumilus maritimus SCM1]
MSVQVSSGKQFIFFLILGIILLIGIEVSLHITYLFSMECDSLNSSFFDYFSEYDKQVLCREYTLANDVSMFDAPVRLHVPDQHGKYVNINSDGWRGEEIKFLDDEYRIFFFGGSTAFGNISTSDETTIPGYLEKKLRDEGYNVKVINVGVSGAATIDEFYVLENLILRFDPDMVIMYDGWNDVAGFNLTKFNIPYQEFILNDALLNNMSFDRFNSSSGSGSGLIKFFERINFKTGIGLFIFYKNIVNEQPTLENIDNSKLDVKKGKVDPKIVEFIQNYMKKYWSKTCELGQTNDFTVVNFIQPILGTSDRVIGDDEKRIMNDTSFINEYSTYLREINLNTGEVKYCDNIFDLRNSFSEMNGINIYLDEGHMSDFGNEIMADSIYNKIFPMIPH